MKKAVLLGDSIRQIGYGTRVSELLSGEYEVYQPEENCRFAKYTLRMLFDYREQIKDSDVIHWNNGLWDVSDLFGDGLFTPVEEYKACIMRIADILLSLCPRVIFATTTPVRDENIYNSNENIITLNNAVVPGLIAKGVEINDLFAAVYPDRNALINEEDALHLSPAGIELCAAKVAEIIRSPQK